MELFQKTVFLQKVYDGAQFFFVGLAGHDYDATRLDFLIVETHSPLSAVDDSLEHFVGEMEMVIAIVTTVAGCPCAVRLEELDVQHDQGNSRRGHGDDGGLVAANEILDLLVTLSFV